MRLAYVCADPGVPVLGRKGASVHVQEVIRAFLRRGTTVDLFAARVDGDPPPDFQGVRLHALDAPPGGALLEREEALLSANSRLGAALASQPPFDIVYERYSLWSHAAMEHARGQAVPGVLEVNAPLIEEQAEHRGLADRAGAEQVAHRAFAAAAAIIAVSSEVAAYLNGFPSARGRVHVIPNGVDPARFAQGVRASRPAESEVFTVGFVGTLKRWHDLDVLCEAFDRLHRLDGRTRLLIVGDGPGRERMQNDLIERGLGAAVEFTGAVSPSEVPALLASMEVAVAPYPARGRFYFSPLKIYEYMAAGLPVVASRVGQIIDVIQDGVNGLLCPPGDAGVMAALLDTLRLDPRLRLRLGQSARDAAMRTHTWDASVERILEAARLTVPV